jgi:ribonuclease BN (tRNA processing enzyme)
MQEEYFPVSLDGMGANWQFLQTKEDHFVFDTAFARVVKHQHPGGAYSYRFHDSDGKVVVFCTDIEHGKSLDPKIVELARGADILIHEGQYTPEELDTHRGWGHSSWEQAVQVAEEARVERLVITHHDPDHDDGFLLDIEQQCQVRFPGAVLAREGMEIVI